MSTTTGSGMAACRGLRDRTKRRFAPRLRRPGGLLRFLLEAHAGAALMYTSIVSFNSPSVLTLFDISWVSQFRPLFAQRLLARIRSASGSGDAPEVASVKYSPSKHTRYLTTFPILVDRPSPEYIFFSTPRRGLIIGAPVKRRALRFRRHFCQPGHTLTPDSARQRLRSATTLQPWLHFGSSRLR